MAQSEQKPSVPFMLLLGSPAFSLTFSVTILSAFLPSLLQKNTNPVFIGLILGAEGFFGLFIPLLVGNVSDRGTTLRDRFKYLRLASIVMVVALVFVGVAKPVLLVALLVALFYVGYYSFLAPYWALYPDLFPKEYSGRSRSAESVWRIAGSLASLISGGFLLSLWHPLPFLIAAGVVALVTTVVLGSLRRRQSERIEHESRSFGDSIRSIAHTVRSRGGLRNLVIANAFWNATLRSISTFVVLFFTIGLNRSPTFVSGVIFPVAAIGMGIMAPLSGKLADTYGHKRIITYALLIYTPGVTLAAFTQQFWLIFVVPVVAGAAATVMALPYALLMRLLNSEMHGAASGLFGVSRGVGSFFGPLLTGAAIVVGKGAFPSTNGYGAMWIMCGIYLSISLLFLRMINAEV